jgi:hypothetical protein
VLHLVWLALLTSCVTSAIAYDPRYPPEYPGETAHLTVEVNVTDGRDGDPRTYYDIPLETARFDRSVAEIVREGLDVELMRFGLRPVCKGGSDEPDLVLNCTVLEFAAVSIKGYVSTGEMKFTVVLGFRWKDPSSGTVMEEHERAERVTKPSGARPSVLLSTEEIERLGDELVNAVLPLVISRELKESETLRTVKIRQSDEHAEILQKLSLALLTDFERNTGQSGEAGTRLAFVGFRNADVRTDPHSAGITSSLMRHWKPPRYRFFSRTFLDSVLAELELQRSDLFDSASVVQLGRLKAVDIIITGSKTMSHIDTAITIQAIRVRDAKVMASTSAVLREKK